MTANRPGQSPGMVIQPLAELPERDDFLTAIGAALDNAPPGYLAQGTGEEGGEWRRCETKDPEFLVYCSLVSYPDATVYGWLQVTRRSDGNTASLSTRRDGTAQFQSRLERITTAAEMVRQATGWSAKLAAPEGGPQS